MQQTTVEAGTTAAVPMEVNQGLKSYFLLCSSPEQLDFCSDPPMIECPKWVHHLSYSAVLGINTSSCLFLKAQATITKQAAPERKAQLDCLFSFHAGNARFP